MLRTVGLRASGLGVRGQSLAVGVLQFSIRNLQGFVKV